MNTLNKQKYADQLSDWW